MKRALLFFGIGLMFMVNLPEVKSQLANNKIEKVVIDAGHGGHDSGAIGKNSREKDIVLKIALQTGKYIEENFHDVEVIYTRKTDKFIELYRRAQIANEENADLFISIHCNSNPSSRPFGTETFVMGLHKSAANLEVAKTENSAILLESDHAINYEGFDPNSDEAYIIFSIFQNLFLDQSLDMAMRVQQQFRERVSRVDRGVKQAGFWVLYKTTMPGILVETGFLSNPEEEKFLLSENGQIYIASAIYRAFKEYKINFEEKNLVDAAELPIVEVTEPAKEEEVFFRVQFASYKSPKSLNNKKFKKLKEVQEYYHKGMYKYTAGNEKTLEKALQLKGEMTGKGYKDAFIVAFVGEKRVTLDEAQEFIK